jgi:hypothetical protein
MKAITLFFERNRSLWLIYVLPFSILFFGDRLFGSIKFIESVSKLLNIESYQIFIFLALIPWLFVKEHPIYRNLSIILLIILVSPLSKINKWFSNTEFAHSVANILGINTLTVLGLLFCIIGLFHPKTRIFSIIAFIIGFFLFKK